MEFARAVQSGDRRRDPYAFGTFVRRRNAALSASLAPLSLAMMQRSAGNAAVAAMLRQTRGGPAAAGVARAILQRSPDFGLATERSTSEYAADALRWRSKYPSTTLESFAEILLAEVNVELEKAGVPSLDSGKDAGGNMALFDPHDWTMSLDIPKATGHPATAKVRELAPDELAEIVQAVYHEARHAEQDFLRARRLASTSPGKSAKTLAEDAGIKESIVAQAIKAGGALSPTQADLADRLEEFRSKYIGYKMWSNRVTKSAKEVDALTPKTDPDGVDSVTSFFRSIEPKIKDWDKEVIWADRQIDTIKKLPRRDSVDDRVLKDLTKTRAYVKGVVDAAVKLRTNIADWQRIKSTEKITAELNERANRVFVSSYRDMRIAMLGVLIESEKAYEQFPEEADTRAVAARVRKTVERRAPPATRPKPLTP